jgi:serine/threonine-protein kinase RsbW
MTQPPPTELRLRLPSDPAEIAGVRHRAEAFARQHGFDECATGEIGLVLNEAIANVIRHAYENVPGKPIEIALRVADGVLDVDVRDYGSGKIPDLRREKTELLTPGGLGLPCMKQMMSDLRFEKQPDGMLLKMTKARRPTESAQRKQ